MQNIDAASNVRLVLVSDGKPEDQQWMDAFIGSAQSGAGDWPHTHPNIPHTTVTRNQVWQAIADNIWSDGAPWSVADLGYPSLAGTGPVMIAKPPSDDPNKGSTSHNLLHSILGDFH